MSLAPPRLIFVYNAEAGVAAGLRDMVHKLVSPSTYPCSLCAVTYGFAGMRSEWRDWLARQSLDAAFYHRQDFHAAYPAMRREALPLVGLDDGGAITVIVPAAELNRVADIDELTRIIGRRLADRSARRRVSARPSSPGP